jgi:two-component system nitrogen regulation response regulator NtrX
MASILIVDDEKNIRRTLRMVLEGEGYTVRDSGSAEEALAQLFQERVDLAILDVRLPGMSGLDLLARLREEMPDLGTIMISGHATLADAVRATKLGADDFCEKPFERERVLISVKNALERRALLRETTALRAEVSERGELLGDAAVMTKLRDDIAKVAPTRGRVLITGESGTGKELVARAIHQQSHLKNGPFVKVNCAAIPPELIESELFGHERGAFTGATQRKLGLFELADGGTIFLDEIGDMALPAQAKVLRVLQQGELTRVGGERSLKIDVRVLAATNKDLAEEVQAGRFREDLYFRLNVVPLRTPPLRDRLDDIPGLVESFVQVCCRENAMRTKGVAAGVYDHLRRYRWPGNVRELRNVIERLVILSDETIEESDLPDEILRARPWQTDPARSGEVDVSSSAQLEGVDPEIFNMPTLREFKEAVEREFIRRKLESFDWNVSRTAASLGIERTNLHKKLKALGLSRAD